MDTEEHNGGKVKDQELQNQTIPFSKNGQKKSDQKFSKEGVMWPTDTWKNISSSLNIREIQVETMRLLPHA